MDNQPTVKSQVAAIVGIVKAHKYLDLDYVCLECSKRMTFKQAKRAMNGDKGCPKYHGVDIDLFVENH